MPWTEFAYQAGPVGGAFTDLLDYCDDVRIPSEMDAPKRGFNPSIPYRDGLFSFPQKYRSTGTFMLDCMVSYTSAAGTVTHADGSAGHVFENLQLLKRLIGGNDGLVVIRRTTPHMGAVEAVCENFGGVTAAGPRMRYVFPMQMLDGTWREQALQTDTESSISSFPHAYTIATGGDYPIGDAKFTFTCVADGNAPTIALAGNGDKISVAGAFVAADVIVVDLARDRSITLNGARYGSVSPNRAYWMRLPPDDATLDVTLDADSGTWTMLIEWRNRWL
jgi:hypothetical protein